MRESSTVGAGHRRGVRMILPIVSAAAVLFVLLVICGSGDSDAASSGRTGDCDWVLDDEGNLTITGSGAMGNYSYGVAPWGTSVRSVVIGNSVTSIGDYAFFECFRLTSVTIPDSVTSIGDYAFEHCSRLTSVTIPDSVTSIREWAFSGCSRLTSVTIPDSVTSIGDHAFDCCFGLTSVTIPDSVTSIGSFAFYYCLCLTSVTIPDSVTSIGGSAFSSCSGLTSVTIPDTVTSIGNSAFSGCSLLTSVTIPDTVTSIGVYAFSSCSGLTELTIPISLNAVNSYDYPSFSGCTNITKVTFTAGTGIGYSYSDCYDKTPWYLSRYVLREVIVPDGVTSIGSYMFSDCTCLTSVTIPDSVTSIGDYEFSGCTSLTSVTIGNSVTSIGSYAFRDCDRDLTLHIDATVPPVLGGPLPDDVTIYVPAASLSDYKAAPYWKDCSRIYGFGPDPDKPGDSGVDGKVITIATVASAAVIAIGVGAFFFLRRRV